MMGFHFNCDSYYSYFNHLMYKKSIEPEKGPNIIISIPISEEEPTTFTTHQVWEENNCFSPSQLESFSKESYSPVTKSYRQTVHYTSCNEKGLSQHDWYPPKIETISYLDIYKKTVNQILVETKIQFLNMDWKFIDQLPENEYFFHHYIKDAKLDFPYPYVDVEDTYTLIEVENRNVIIQKSTADPSSTYIYMRPDNLELGSDLTQCYVKKLNF